MRKATCLLISFLIFATPILAYERGTCVIYEDQGLWSCYDDKNTTGCHILNDRKIKKNRRKYGKNNKYMYEYRYEFYDKEYYKLAYYDCQDYCLKNEGRCSTINGKTFYKENYEGGKYKLFRKGDDLGLVGQSGVFLFNIGFYSLALAGITLTLDAQNQYEGDNEEHAQYTVFSFFLTLSMHFAPIGLVLYISDGGKLDDDGLKMLIWD